MLYSILCLFTFYSQRVSIPSTLPGIVRGLTGNRVTESLKYICNMKDLLIFFECNNKIRVLVQRQTVATPAIATAMWMMPRVQGSVVSFHLSVLILWLPGCQKNYHIFGHKWKVSLGLEKNREHLNPFSKFALVCNWQWFTNGAVQWVMYSAPRSPSSKEEITKRQSVETQKIVVMTSKNNYWGLNSTPCDGCSECSDTFISKQHQVVCGLCNSSSSVVSDLSECWVPMTLSGSSVVLPRSSIGR